MQCVGNWPGAALAVLGLLLAAGVRGAASWLLPDLVAAWMLAGTLWCLSFALYLAHLAPTLIAARNDGHGGCHGVKDNVSNVVALGGVGNAACLEATK